MNTRFYTPSDYQQLISLYKQSTEFPFDEVTDSEAGLLRKIERDPESIILVEDDGKIVGSVCIIEDGRIPLLFRLVAENTHAEKSEILSTLIEKAQEVLRERGYLQVHNTAPEGNEDADTIRAANGFTKGKEYRWYWKEL